MLEDLPGTAGFAGTLNEGGEWIYSIINQDAKKRLSSILNL
jgi:hypothetical protein